MRTKIEVASHNHRRSLRSITIWTTYGTVYSIPISTTALVPDSPCSFNLILLSRDFFNPDSSSIFLRKINMKPTIILSSTWKTAVSCFRSTCGRTFWKLTTWKQFSARRREFQNRSNRRRKLPKSVQIASATAAFMRLLLMLQAVQLLSRSVSISCTKHKVLFFIKRIQIITRYPSSPTFHTSLWYTLCIVCEVSVVEGVIECLLI